MKRVLRRLDAVHDRLLAEVSGLDAEQLTRKPGPNQWSIAEVLHHLCLVERRILQGLERELSQPPQRIGVMNRLVPFSLLVGRRVRRVQAPRAVEPVNPPPGEMLIENYNQVRSDLKAFSQQHGRERLKSIVLIHPFLGKFTGVKAVAFVGHHERRHLKQIREIIKKLERAPAAATLHGQ